jgi:uncharacterized protein YgbK (DUF1537 family)
MRSPWLIIADDLTGACDSAVAFAARGMCTEVIWRNAKTRDGIDVLACNTASREMSVTEAAHASHNALERYCAPGTKVFKKIDSTLRGQPASEIRAIHGWLGARQGSALGILAPAYPAMGRTTVAGHVHVSGQPLETTETWQRDHTYSTADLLDVLRTVDITALKVPLSTIRAPGSVLTDTLQSIAQQGAFAVCDAETQADLDALAHATTTLRSPHFFAGAGGLALALARCCEQPTVSASSIVFDLSDRGALIAVGSLARESRIAARELSSDAKVRRISVDPRVLYQASVADQDTLSREMIELIAAGVDVLAVVEFDELPPASLIPKLLTGLSAVLGPVACTASAVVATGGETAAAMLDAIEAQSIRLIDELEPGICLGVTSSPNARMLVTKAGAFGNAQCLVRVVHRLRHIRMTGRL